MDIGSSTLNCYLREGESVQLPEPTVRRYHSRVKGNAASVDQTRTITLLLRISSNTSGDLVWGKIKAIRRKFRQARRGWGSGSQVIGQGVAFWLRYWDLANYTYYDVLDGSLKVTKQDFGASYVIECEVTLTCLPFGRGQAVTLAASGTLTNGLSGSYFLPVTVPGDEEAICQITLADLGGGSTPINRFRLGRRSLDGMASGDYTAVLDSGAATGATHGTGDATAQGSEYYRITPPYQWSDVALFTCAGDKLNHGDMDLLLRVRDSTAFIGTPFNLKAAAGIGGGSLAASNNYVYTISVTEVDAAGSPYTPYVGPSSDAVSVSLAGSQNQIVVTWADEGTPANHLITMTYGTLIGVQTQAFYQTAGTSYTITALGGAPLGSGMQVIFPLEFQVGVAVGNVGATLPDSAYLWGTPITTQLGGSRWELRYAGTLPCPPMPQMEGYASQPYQIKVQAKLQDIALAGSTFDVDVLYLLPHDECQTVVEIPGLTNGSTNYTWILDTRRDERGTCLLTSSGVVQYALTPEGPFFLGPGGNLLIIAAENTGGVHDIASTYAVTVRYAPRYLDPQAVGT